MALQSKLPKGHLGPVQLAVRASAAAGISVAVAQALALAYPLYAMISAVIVTDPDPVTTRQQSWRRFLATLIGAGVGALLSPFLHLRPLLIAVAILITMLLCHVFRLGASGRVAGYICGIVVLDFSDQPWDYAWHRLLETTLGIAAALLVSLVPRLYRAHDEANAGKDT